MSQGARAGRRDFAAAARPARIVLTASILIGLLLVASGLYLWRRPPAPPDASARAAAASSAPEDAGPPAAVEAPPPPPPVTLSDARVLGCHDKGPAVTPPDACDHVAPVEKALSHAIEEAASCVPESAGGGTIEYVADVSFTRRRIRVALPRAGRSLHELKVIRACAAAVRDGMKAVSFDGVDHRHARYSIAVTATYRAAPAAPAASGAASSRAAPAQASAGFGRN